MADDEAMAKLAQVLASFEVGEGVDVSKLSPEMMPLLVELARAAKQRELAPLRITSGFRSTHPVSGEPDTGFHGLGLGLDIGATDMRPDIARDLSYLGRAQGYQSVDKLHGTGPHIHYELDTPSTRTKLPGEK